ncbi:CNP1-like family protein [Caballeronia hypogeia]|uniref:CNP1-like family protein n=1 Tax=Caballeronia hypogeia TaxID=1777140 RepID=UPI0007729363|nr:CNP1-like family protein [Caballeronia hypogeia]
MKASLAVIVASAATLAALAGCSSSKTPTTQDDGVFTYLLDRKTTWAEEKIDTMPPLPKASNLLAFNVSQNTPLTFAVDKSTLTVGKDGVVRYVIVVTSPVGARNVNYEGIRCDTYEWRRYASINDDQNGWDQGAAFEFKRIENGELNAYQAALYQDYFCASKLPVGSAEQIVNNIQYKRTQTNINLR